MSISNEILKLIENGTNEWDEVYKELTKYHTKKSCNNRPRRWIRWYSQNFHQKYIEWFKN